MFKPNAVDDQILRRSVYLSALGSAWTLIPFLGGSTLMAGTWMLGGRPELGLLAGLAGVLGAVGMFVTTLIFRGESYARRALMELQEEGRREREAQLDRLEEQLVADGDPRTDEALRDLRALTATFEALNEREEDAVDQALLINIQTNVIQMFDQAVRSLEQSVALWQSIEGLSTRQAREALAEKREAIIEDILLSIRQLGALLAFVQGGGAGAGQDSELAQAREELDQSLQVARQTDARLRAFEEELRTGVTNKMLDPL